MPSAVNDMGDSIEQDVIRVEEDWSRAIVANDADAIAVFIADDWTIVGSNGGLADKQTFLDLVRSGELTHDVMDGDDLRVRVFGDTAVVTGKGISGGRFRGSPFRAVERFSDIFVRQRGRWRCVLTHLTTIASEN